MYRQYENPYPLEKELEALEYEYDMAILGEADEETIADIAIEIAELKDRINFAWQDDEYEEMHMDYEDELWIWENVR
jgi:hypothetical protein